MLKKWMLKAIVQKTISYLPYKTKINYFFQRYITKGVLLTDDYFELKIIHAKEHLDFFNHYMGNNTNDKTTLELGSGWYPIVPVTMFLSGFETIISLDIASWMNKKTILQTLEMFVEWSKTGKLEEYFPNIQEERWMQLQEILRLQNDLDQEQICRLLRLKLMVKDARNTELPDASIDFIMSNNTFEHIYPGILKDIVKEFKRIVASDGLMSHFIDLTDHFAHFDNSVTIYNFLKFSRKQWATIDNSIQPMNRLRWKDYIKMYQDLDIPFIEEKVRIGDLETLATVDIHSEYAEYSPKELAISHGYFITK